MKNRRILFFLKTEMQGDFFLPFTAEAREKETHADLFFEQTLTHT